MTTLLGILKAGRALITDPQAWIQGHEAKSICGVVVCPKHPLAVCFCSVGALIRVSQLHEYAAAKAALREGCVAKNVETYNDSNLHTEVLAMWDRAISKLEGVAA